MEILLSRWIYCLDLQDKGNTYSSAAMAPASDMHHAHPLINQSCRRTTPSCPACTHTTELGQYEVLVLCFVTSRFCSWTLPLRLWTPHLAVSMAHMYQALQTALRSPPRWAWGEDGAPSPRLGSTLRTGHDLYHDSLVKFQGDFGALDKTKRKIHGTTPPAKQEEK